MQATAAGLLFVLFSSCCKKKSKSPSFRWDETTWPRWSENQAGPKWTECLQAQILLTTERQPGHSQCTREGKLKEERTRLFPRLLIKQWWDLIFSLCSCFHSQEALPYLDFTFVFFEITSFFFFFWPRHMACRILVPQPGVQPVPSEVETQES